MIVRPTVVRQALAGLDATAERNGQGSSGWTLEGWGPAVGSSTTPKSFPSTEKATDSSNRPADTGTESKQATVSTGSTGHSRSQTVRTAGRTANTCLRHPCQ